VRLPSSGPFDPDGVTAFLAARAVPGVEEVDVAARTYRRGPVRVVLLDDGAEVAARAATRVRRLLALDVDPRVAADALAADPVLAPLVAARPGLRVPGAWDAFEVAVRAVVGQQVTVAAARTLLARIVARCGVAGRFPSPGELLGADLSAIGMPGSRVATLRAVAAAVAEGLDPADGSAFLAVRGIGPWTAAYVAMRLGDLDAFPIGDAGLRLAAGPLGLPTEPKALLARAERWRPYRAVATVHLWSTLA
jgi:AraC family transcriptional regulator of adaptative response / DNA-3-methyladenine glycosylase II